MLVISAFILVILAILAIFVFLAILAMLVFLDLVKLVDFGHFFCNLGISGYFGDFGN